MPPDGSDERSVLVVDDDPEMVALYEGFLEGTFEVETATSGRAALALVDDDVDVVLLDRRMPGLSGDDVLDAIRNRGYRMPAMYVTAVDPNVEVDRLPVDDYVQKPIEREVLVNKVTVLATRAAFDRLRERLFDLALRKATLEADPEVTVRENSEYAAIVERMAEVRTDLSETVDSLFDRGVAVDP